MPGDKQRHAFGCQAGTGKCQATVVSQDDREMLAVSCMAG
jgi:hypothetical protein